MGCREGLHTHLSSENEKAGQETCWRDGPSSRAHGGEKRIDVYGKYIRWCQTPGFIVREKTNPTTETHLQLRIHTEANDFPIKPVLLDINI